jgi:hypothetical protein
MSRKWEWFTQEEIGRWPAEHKACRKCLVIKPFSEFHKNDNGKQLFGLASDCKLCRKEKSRIDWKNKKSNVKKNILARSKSRAKEKNLPFDLSEKDLNVPELCPVFGKPLLLDDPDWTYSIDRIVPELGYVSGNVIIVSNKANRIKSNATPEEILAVGNFYKSLSV